MATIEDYQEAYPDCAYAVYIHESRLRGITWIVASMMFERFGFDRVLDCMKRTVSDSRQELEAIGTDTDELLRQMDTQQFRSYLAAKLGMM